MVHHTKKAAATELMVVNDLPGEECRIAFVKDNHLEELYSEHTATATNVGNIYKGRVVNVEPAIQAAFIDYGQGQNGFLHISDLHPRYFPGHGRTERVGRKIPRRDRPPIQQALKRGDEVLVQVLKEGIGTKGPTLTSYPSIPGRLLVAMPEMDRVGVSRKLEDPEKRRELRKVLDSLDLPEGFGFILRTAGFGQSKTELKRDVAYLMRLWKVMEQRIQSVRAPCELYTESSLLIRTIRDVLRPSIGAIIVDSDEAFERVSAFLRVVAPRSAPKVIRYRRQTPIFHAFDLERQIELIHSREVPLPSGGKLVIEQTEALVAIDVNSGKSRSARDSETNAYQTNREAVDEICRQLRLRDLGGLIINDLIDMHNPRHRRDIEEQFTRNLKTDRAKTTILRISAFGVLEMTRQRMRPSLRKSHFMPCPNCLGHGDIKTPESVGADALRQIGHLLQYERVHRLEIVCSPKVASVLLSSKRRQLVALEDDVAKQVNVRVSDAVPADRVDYYAYDDRNADIDLPRLPPLEPPTLAALEREDQEPAPTAEPAAAAGTEPRRRRRRRRGPGPADATAIALAGDYDGEAASAQAEGDGAAVPAGAGRRRRRTSARAAAAEARADGAAVRIHTLAKQLGVPSRDILARCRKHKSWSVKNHMSSVNAEQAQRIRDWFQEEPAQRSSAADGAAPASETPAFRPADGSPGRKKRRRRKKKAAASASTETAAEEAPAAASETSSSRKKRRRRKKKVAAAASTETAAEEAPATASETSSGRKKRRRRKKKVSAAAATETALEEAPAAGSETSSSRKKRRRRKKKVAAAAATETALEEAPAAGSETSASRKKRKRSRRLTRKKAPATSFGSAEGGVEPGRASPGGAGGAPDGGAGAGAAVGVAAKKRRRLYRRRTPVSAAARESAARSLEP